MLLGMLVPLNKLHTYIYVYALAYTQVLILLNSCDYITSTRTRILPISRLIRINMCFINRLHLNTPIEPKDPNRPGDELKAHYAVVAKEIEDAFLTLGDN